jgi:hypothetical protein
VRERAAVVRAACGEDADGLADAHDPEPAAADGHLRGLAGHEVVERAEVDGGLAGHAARS